MGKRESRIKSEGAVQLRMRSITELVYSSLLIEHQVKDKVGLSQGIDISELKRTY